MDTKVILFDLGGVLIDVVSTRRIYEITGEKRSLEEISRIWGSSAYLRLFESGGCDKWEFAKGVIKELGMDISPDAFLHEFAAFTKSFYKGAGELLLSLCGYTLACVTDTNSLQWESMCERLAVDKYFQYHFLSYRIKKCKPDPEVYEYILKTLDCTPEEIVYFDDRSVNVQAGADAGMRAYVVDGAAALKEKLKSLKLI